MNDPKLKNDSPSTQEGVTASYQAAFATQITTTLDQQHLISILKNIHPEQCLNFLSRKSLNETLLTRHHGRWSWGELSSNITLPWSEELIDQFKSHWDWIHLSRNIALPWSLKFIERFKDHWHWGQLSSNTRALAILPVLKPEDVTIIMAHHFPDDSGCKLPTLHS
ncbi:hypothetical protein TAO_1744 [Candidatus Nitrosoglobus terrae]|uniref:Uncharacterized protein n=1 Tax=Candidatus Nitrosoglobus terrae TaxID=1630141 RepID=A0A1Q2SPP8_9GAMM|nr:hypothetical protein [Candidatus Nitrosoglobus terrae]BAW81114.1 hypothetical protein TAO_1744 [Candidatus Nitrosoglobus terrae]